MTDTTDKETFDCWAILELMGHRKLAGHVTEQEIGGKMMLRIDVPNEDGSTFATQFYGAEAVYCITPTTEELARAAAQSRKPAPVHRYELELPAPYRASPVDDDEDDDGVPI